VEIARSRNAPLRDKIGGGGSACAGACERFLGGKRNHSIEMTPSVLGETGVQIVYTFGCQGMLDQ